MSRSISGDLVQKLRYILRAARRFDIPGYTVTTSTKCNLDWSFVESGQLRLHRFYPLLPPSFETVRIFGFPSLAPYFRRRKSEDSGSIRDIFDRIVLGARQQISPRKASCVFCRFRKARHKRRYYPGFAGARRSLNQSYIGSAEGDPQRLYLSAGRFHPTEGAPHSARERTHFFGAP